MPMCCTCLPAIRLQPDRSPSRCAQSSINTGLQTTRQSAKRAIGGGVNCWELTRLLWSVSRMAGLDLWICRSHANHLGDMQTQTLISPASAPNYEQDLHAA